MTTELRRKPSAAMHTALRLIGRYDDPVNRYVSEREVAVVTLRALLKYRLIARMRDDRPDDPSLPRRSYYGNYDLTADGRKLAERLGPWTPHDAPRIRKAMGL